MRANRRCARSSTSWSRRSATIATSSPRRETFISAARSAIYRMAWIAPPGLGALRIPGRRSARRPADAGQLPRRPLAPGRSSPTLRGQAMRELLLCQIGAGPAAGTSTSRCSTTRLVACPPRRERLTAHQAKPVCAGCHKITDPIGLALENFDGAGQLRADERGEPIDASGRARRHDVQRCRGTRRGDARESGRAGLPRQAALCLRDRRIARARRREVMLPELRDRVCANGYRVPELVREIAVSDGLFAVDGQPSVQSAVCRRRLRTHEGSRKIEHVTRRRVLRGVLRRRRDPRPARARLLPERERHCARRPARHCPCASAPGSGASAMAWQRSCRRRPAPDTTSRRRSQRWTACETAHQPLHQLQHFRDGSPNLLPLLRLGHHAHRQAPVERRRPARRDAST